MRWRIFDKEMPVCLFRNPNKYETSKTNICWGTTIEVRVLSGLITTLERTRTVQIWPGIFSARPVGSALIRFLCRKKSLNELNYIWNELQNLQLPTSPEERERGVEIKGSAFTSTPLLGRSDEIRSSSTESQNSVQAEIIPVKIKKSNISENFSRQHPDIYANVG